MNTDDDGKEGGGNTTVTRTGRTGEEWLQRRLGVLMIGG
jgi:hypothetical protein